MDKRLYGTLKTMYGWHSGGTNMKVFELTNSYTHLLFHGIPTYEGTIYLSFISYLAS